MKRIVFLLLFLLSVTVNANHFADVVSTDSIAFDFVLLDSVGNPASLASGDSVYMMVFNQSGAITYRDSLPYNGTPIGSAAWEDFAGGQIYTLTYLVDDIDGTANYGNYTVKIWAQDLTSASLITPTTHTFDLAEFNYIDSIKALSVALEAVRDSVQYLTTVTGFATAAAQTAMRDSLQYLVTATGFSTHSAADVWSVATRQLTATQAFSNTGTWTGNITGNLSGSVGSVTGAVGSIGTGGITTVSYAAGAINAAAIAADAITSSELAGSAATEIGTATWATTTRQLTGTQTFNNTGTWTGNITGSLSGSVGSVTGAVGSVTGAVGSVTGNVGGNVTGSVGSVVADVTIDATSVDLIWDEDSTGHYTSPNMAFVASQTGAGASITDAIMGAIADSVWLKDTSDYVTVGQPTNMGEMAVIALDTSRFADAVDFTAVRDTVNAVHDTLQNQDNWVAKEASLFDGDLSSLATLAVQSAIRDTVNAIMDSVQLYLDAAISGISGGGGSDTVAIKAMIHNNFLAFDNVNRRYISLSGDNSDGLTWETAWTHPDSITTHITSGSRYHVLVDAGDYGVVDSTIINNVDYVYIEGVNGMPVFHYNTDTNGTGTWSPTNGKDISECIYTNANYTIIDNIRFTGDGLYALNHYSSDPDADSLSVTNRGGKNAIFLDNADYAVIMNCVFDSAYKPVVAWYKADVIDSSSWGVLIENNIFRDNEYHSIDADLSFSVIRNNTFIRTNVSASPPAGAIQLLADRPNYNMIYENYFHGYGYGTYFNVSDSNAVFNNYFGSELIADGSGEAMRSYSTAVDAPNNFFVGNHTLSSKEPVEGGRNILPNSGFEYPGENLRHIPFWGSNDWSSNYQVTGADIRIAPFGYVNSAVDESDGSSSGKLGHSLFLMAGDSVDYIRQNTNVFALDAGEAQFSMKVLPNSPIIPDDSIRVLLYEDTNYDGSFSAYAAEVYYFLSDGGSAWEDASHVFTIVNAGNYYMNIAGWSLDSGDGFYIDDVFLAQYAGQIAGVSATIDYDTLASLVNDTLTAAHGAGAWTSSAGGTGANSVTIVSTDTAGTGAHVAVEMATVTVTNASTLVQVGVQVSDANGETDWALDNGTYTVETRKPWGWWEDTTITVTGAQTDSAYGYIFDAPEATTSHTCNVSILVMGNDGLPRANVTVTASLAGSNLIDSNGVAVSNQIQRLKTSSTGIVTFPCIASTWLVPNTSWIFVIHDPSVGVRFQMPVPDQPSVTVNINDYR